MKKFIASALLAVPLTLTMVTGCEDIAPSSHSVTYSVSGSATAASLTYNNEQGGTQQEEVSLPWSKTFTMKSGDFVYISAQNKGETGNVTAKIEADGETIKEGNTPAKPD